MNRRRFLELLGLSTAGLALAPKKFYFDYGANLYKTQQQIYLLEKKIQLLIEDIKSKKLIEEIDWIGDEARASTSSFPIFECEWIPGIGPVVI